MGAVALMRIGVQNEDPQVWLREVLLADGDGDVIEHAVPLALVRVGMMGPAGEITCQSVRQRRLGRRQGAGDLQTGTGKQSLRSGQPKLDRGDVVQRPGADLFEVCVRMDQSQLVERRRLDAMDR